MDQDDVIQASELLKQSEIAKGGFGVVYKGKWQGGLDVAIKELYIQKMPQQTLKEIEQEIIIAKKMKHPNIVVVYGYCVAPLSLVMEYLPLSLYLCLHQESEISWQIRFQISLDITFGLEYLHEKNIIHKNLTSNNVLLDSNMRAKITDFGLSRIKSESKLKESKLKMQNLRWMSPEVLCQRSNFNQESDIYALGMILWEIASRRIPFQDTEDQLIEEGVRQGQREMIPEDCPQEFKALIEGC